MAGAVHPTVSGAMVPRAFERSERLLLIAILTALGSWLAVVLELNAAFGLLGTVGEWIAVVLPWAWLPWACLVVGTAALIDLFASRGVGVGFTGNRHKYHVVGWTVVGLCMLVLSLSGSENVSSVLAMLGKSGKIIAEFTGTHGLFFAAVAALIAGGIFSAGSGGAAAAKPGIIGQFFVSNLTAKVSAAPMVLVACGIFFGGTIWTVVYSFTNSKLLPRREFVGLDQYERLWGENRWWISIENLAIFGILSLVFSLVIGFFLAVLLDQKIRFENTFRTIFLYPFALSFIVTGLVWQWLLNPDYGLQEVVRSIPITFHWLETLGAWFGRDWPGDFSGFTFDPLYNADIVIFGILFAGLWHGTGLIMCLMLAGLRGIDEDIWKAARVDGIPTWKTYIFIIIPMMRPVFVTTLVLIASGIIRLYDLVVAQTSGGPGLASQVPAMYVYQYMFLGQNLAQGFAASTMMLVTVLVILIPWAILEFGGSKKRV